MPRDKKTFREVPHTSEVAIQVGGENWKTFFESAAAGLLAVYAADGKPALSKTGVKLKADSAEELLVAWLNELNFLVSGRRWLPVSVKVTEAYPTQLKAELEGGPLGDLRLSREIKAATFGGLHIKKAKKGWTATVILDV